MFDFEKDIKRCVEVLEAGGVILYPTDTVWGLGCDAMNEKAVERIFEIKHRPANKSLIILMADARSVLQHVAAPPPDIIDIIENFDTPTTVVYDGALDFPDNVVHTDGSIAVRVTTDPFCKALIKRFKKPIVSTSANISGRPTPAIFNRIEEQVKQDADYVVTYRQDDISEARSSRLVKINEDGSLDILRA